MQELQDLLEQIARLVSLPQQVEALAEQVKTLEEIVIGAFIVTAVLIAICFGWLDWRISQLNKRISTLLTVKLAEANQAPAASREFPSGQSEHAGR